MDEKEVRKKTKKKERVEERDKGMKGGKEMNVYLLFVYRAITNWQLRKE